MKYLRATYVLGAYLISEAFAKSDLLLGALFELDFLKSLIYFPATLYTVALLINCDILAIIAAVRNSEESLRKITAKPFLLIPVIVMLNFIVRNILLILGIDYIGDLR